MVLSARNGSTLESTQAPIALIAARSLNHVIGCSNQLPWKQRDDLRRFKRITTGKPVIVGRHTYESIGSPLSGRQTIVLTRNAQFATNINSQNLDNVVATTSINDAIELANEFLENSNLARSQDEIIVAGGQEIFEAFISIADKIYLTVVEAVIENGDAFFPLQEELPQMREKLVGRHESDSCNEHRCTYYEYVKECSVNIAENDSAGDGCHRHYEDITSP